MHKELAVRVPNRVRGRLAKGKAVAQLLLRCLQTVSTVRPMKNISIEPSSLPIPQVATSPTSARAR